MLKSIMTAILVVISAVSLKAETCIRMKDHTDASYHHGTIDPAVDSESELWIGEGRIASISDNYHLILDLSSNILTIMQMSDSTYVETELPLDMAKVVSPERMQRLAMYPTKGEVKPAGKTKKIDGRECLCYNLVSWIDYRGTRYRETEISSWFTTDLPFDPAVLEKYHDTVYRMNNLSDDYREARMAAKGLEIFSESTQYAEGQARKGISEVAGIEEKDPPENVYTVPGWFKKSDFLSFR
ncbi:MAG: hypothetical protein JW814_09715 [Candidatus Krumholzibacteriota bacterium]|nr:hypothetical protein [Candidatus Krumholzibacteriota bacterium]